MTVDAVS
jgi:hypothetical protein